MRKVRKGSVYTYNPVLMDQLDPPYNINAGDAVKVIQLPGCPGPNVMGHCHVAHLNGDFAGLVHVNSLIKQ